MPSLSASVICKILTVFLLFCLTKASGGSCLSYGHSCWGGHGKRNGASQLMGTTSQKRSSEWYISRLFNPSVDNLKKLAAIFKSQNQNGNDVEKLRKYGFQFQELRNPVLDITNNVQRDEFKELNAESKSEKWGSDINDSEEELIMLTPEVQQMPVSKFGFFPILDQESGRKRTGN